MTCSRVTYVAILLLLGICIDTADAGRLYGNASYSLEYVSINDQRGSTEESLSRESAVINFEDALFTKNQLRLTANLQRREFSFSDYHEFRPIYIADLRSYGYTFNVRYSPYTRRSRLSGADDLLDVRYRDWRVTGQLNYPDWPTVNVIYSRLKSFDDDVRRTDTYSRDWVAGASYTYELISLRANFSELKQIDNIARQRATITRTYNGTAAVNRTIAGFGYLSTTYNYYETRRSAQDITSQKSFTHSVSSLFSSNVIPMVSLSASYSGRFLESERDQFESSIATQNMSGMVGFSPVDYLNVKFSKGYQINSQLDDHDITEYLALGATVTRYIRQGVDTRLSFNRTIFQQSQRVRTIIDTSGTVVTAVNDDDFTVDTYHGAFNFSPRAYFKAYVNATLTHDSDPVDPDRKYQFTRSIDARATPTRKIEGRLTYTAVYLGRVLKIDEAFSNNYNVGVTYTPQSNLNLNLTYIYSTYNTTFSTNRSSFTGFISYTFRRAFNVYVSVNRQSQEQQVFLPGFDTGEVVELHPRSINGQLLVYMSRDLTLALSYVNSQSESVTGVEIENESIQGVLTLQI